MAVAGIVITLDSEDAAAGTLDVLGRDGRLTLGARAGVRVPAVVDTPSPGTDRECLEWLQQLPGVLQVELCCVLFPEEPRSEP